MERISYYGKEYLVSSKIKKVIEKVTEYCLADDIDISEKLTKLLGSKNYQEGKISEDDLFSALKCACVHQISDNWINILTSEIYGKGLIPDDIVHKLPCLLTSLDWNVIDKKHTSGIIQDKHLNLIFSLIKRDYCIWNKEVELQERVNAILLILISNQYAEGKISEDTINITANMSSLVPNNEYVIKFRTIARLFDKKYIEEDSITDEILKLILEERIILIIYIIEFITLSEIMRKEEKIEYIQAILKLENKTQLENLYNLYEEKRKVIGLNEFAMNFVLYSLPMLKFDLKGSYIRKKYLILNNNKYNEFVN